MDDALPSLVFHPRGPLGMDARVVEFEPDVQAHGVGMTAHKAWVVGRARQRQKVGSNVCLSHIRSSVGSDMGVAARPLPFYLFMSITPFRAGSCRLLFRRQVVGQDPVELSPGGDQYLLGDFKL